MFPYLGTHHGIGVTITRHLRLMCVQIGLPLLLNTNNISSIYISQCPLALNRKGRDTRLLSTVHSLQLNCHTAIPMTEI